MYGENNMKLQWNSLKDKDLPKNNEKIPSTKFHCKSFQMLGENVYD
jgi:hypothetical protein